MGTLSQCVCPGQQGTVKGVTRLLLSLSELGELPTGCGKSSASSVLFLLKPALSFGKIFHEHSNI